MSNVEVYRIKFGEKYEPTYIEEYEDGKIILTIPEYGGHVMTARSSLQEEWITKTLEKIKGVNHIWITQWEITSKSALEKIRKFLKKEEQKFNEEEDYYKDLYSKGKK